MRYTTNSRYNEIFIILNITKSFVLNGEKKKLNLSFFRHKTDVKKYQKILVF